MTDYDSKAFQNFKKAVENCGSAITVPKAGDSFTLGDAVCTILAVNTGSDTNNTSIVLRIVYGDTSFLFTGDAERDTEQAILARGTDVHSTVLKVGHHGSDTSTGYLWLREVDPEYAVISVGKGNSYGHPTEAVLSRLRDGGGHHLSDGYAGGHHLHLRWEEGHILRQPERRCQRVRLHRTQQHAEGNPSSEK